MMTPDDEQTIRRIVRDKVLATLTKVIAIIGLLVALAHAAPTPTPLEVPPTAPSTKPERIYNCPYGYEYLTYRCLPPESTPHHHLTIHKKMQRDHINWTRNLGPHDPRPAPRTNVPPTVPLQFLPGVPTTDMRPR